MKSEKQGGYKKEVTQGPKPLGAQLPYESDPFEPGNLI